MKILAERDALAPALSTLAKIVPKKTSIPILANLRLEAQGNTLILSAHALDTCMDIRVQAEVTEPGIITVEAEALRSIVLGMAQGAQVSLALGGDKLTVRSSRSRYVLPTLPAADFPPLLEPSAGAAIIRIEAADVDRLLSSPANFVEKSDSSGRPMLEGVWLHRREGRLCGCGTDGKSLFISQGGAPEGCDQIPSNDFDGNSVIVPGDAVPALCRALAGGGSLLVGKNIIAAQGSDCVFATKLLEFHYPDAWRIVPPLVEDRVLICDRRDLAAALTRLTVLVSAKVPRIRLTWDAGGEELMVCLDHATSRGRGEENIPLRAPVLAGGQIIVAQPRLLQIVGALAGEFVEIHISDTSGGETRSRIADPSARDTVIALAGMQPEVAETMEAA